MKRFKIRAILRYPNLRHAAIALLMAFNHLGADAASLNGCSTVFKVTSDDSHNLEYPRSLDALVRQFAQLLIDLQKKSYSSSERRWRLADANRILEELTDLDPEIPKLLQREWRDRLTGSYQPLESRRTPLLAEIHALEEDLAAFKQQSKGLREWTLLIDSNQSSALNAELQDLLTRQRSRPIETTSLSVKRSRYIVTDKTKPSDTLDSHKKGGHQSATHGAQLLSSGSILSWSSDRTLIIWSFIDGEFKAIQRIGAVGNTDPRVGHTNWVEGAKVLSDGRILTWSGDRRVIFWKLENDKFVVEHELGKEHNKDAALGHTDCVVGARVLSDGRVLSWAGDHALLIWKLEENQFVVQHRLGEPKNLDPDKGHTAWINGARMLADGRVLSWSVDRSLVVWKHVSNTYSIDQKLGQPENEDTESGHIAQITDAELLSNGMILSTDEDLRSIFWELSPPDAIQARLKAFSQKLDLLKGELKRLSDSVPNRSEVSLSDSTPLPPNP